MEAKVVKYLDLPIALVSLWVPPAPGMVPSMWLQIMVLVNLNMKADQLLSSIEFNFLLVEIQRYLPIVISGWPNLAFSPA